MANVKIDPTKGPIYVEINCTTLHVVGFHVLIIASDGNTTLESYNSDTTVSNPYTIKLPNTCDKYIGCYVSGEISITEPDGNATNYNIIVAIIQNGIIIQPSITLNGTSSDDPIKKATIFHLQ